MVNAQFLPALLRRVYDIYHNSDKHLNGTTEPVRVAISFDIRDGTYQAARPHLISSKAFERNNQWCLNGASKAGKRLLSAAT
jgi:hypothetical protein